MIKNILTHALLLISLHAGAALSKLPDPSQPMMHGKSITLSEHLVELKLDEAIYLALRDNRQIRSAYFDRIAQKFDLEVSRDQFSPKLNIIGRQLSNRNYEDTYRQGEITPQATILGQYGTLFSLSWRNEITSANKAGRSRSDGASLTVIQPLLRGAGKDVTSAPLNLAKLSERLNILNLQSTVSNTITQVISSYQDLVRAQLQLKIAKDALARSHELLDANKMMIAAGRMARFDIVQTEADVATQELSVEEAINQLDASRLNLLQLLAIDTSN